MNEGNGSASIEALADEIATMAAQVDAATQRMLACIRAFDEAEGWQRSGAISCAHWLAWRVGLDTATAREKVRVARALGGLQRIDAAFARGELSYAKVRALTRVATSQTEERLLDLARHATGAQLERICRGFRQVANAEATPSAAVEDRTVRSRDLPGGMVKIELVLHPDEAALVMSAIAKAQDMLRKGDDSRTVDHAATPGDEDAAACARENAEDPFADVSAEAPAPARADGVVFMAQHLLSGDAIAAGGGRHHHSIAGHQIFVHLDQDVLAPDGHVAATLDDGTRVSAETLRRIACDAGLVAAVTSDQETRATPLDIGRRTRTISPALRRALWLRDRGCRFPGCPHTRFLHGHHIQHWLHGGATRLDNLVLLCPRHHQLVHEGGFQLQPRAGQFVVETPARQVLWSVPPVPSIADDPLAFVLAASMKEHSLVIDAATNFPAWDGTVPDYDLVIDGLLKVA